MAFKRDQAKNGIVASEEDDPDLAAKLAEARAKKTEIDRQSGMQGHLHKITVCGVYLIGSLIIVAVAVWLLHFIVPTQWRFLTDLQLESLQNILFSGVVGSLLGGQAKRLAK